MAPRQQGEVSTVIRTECAHRAGCVGGVGLSMRKENSAVAAARLRPLQQAEVLITGQSGGLQVVLDDEYRD